MSLARQFVDRIGQKLPPPGADAPSTSPLDQIPEGELVFLQPRLSDKVMVDATVTGTIRNRELFLSFKEFVDGLEMPIRVDPVAATAQGWYIQEKNIWVMDLKNNLVQSRGEQYTVRPEEWFFEDGQLFIAASAITNWMKIETGLRPEELILDLAADTPFPLEARIARRERDLQKDIFETEPQLPRAPNPYARSSIPNASVSINTRARRNDEQETTLDSTLGVSVAGDVLGHTGRGFIGYSDNAGLGNIQATLEKQSEKPDLLGPMKAKRYQIGDIDPANLDLTGQNERGFGARITNAVDGEIDGDTRRTFEGDLPPDWEVELYNGLQLIGFQSPGNTGRFVFRDVELYSGDNDFRLVFYGPRGEIREETVNIPVDFSTIGKGRGLYDISATLNQVQTYESEQNDDPDRNTPNFVVRYEQGVRDGLSLNTGFRATTANEKDKWFGNIGATWRWDNTIFNTSIVTDEEGELAFQNTSRRSWGAHDISGTFNLSTKGYNPDNTDTPPAFWRSSLGVRGPLATLFGQKFSYTFGTQFSKNADGDATSSATFEQSGRLGSYNINHTLNYSHQDDDFLQSTLAIRRSIGETRLRGTVRYVYLPDAELIPQLNFSVSRNLTDTIQGTLEYERDIKTDFSRMTAQANIQNEKYVLSPQISYDSNKELQANLNLRFGLVYDKDERRVIMSRNSADTEGAVRAKVYIDRNGNRRQDPGDDPVPNAMIMGVQIARSQTTNDKGIAFLTNLPEYEPTDIILDPASLEDPYLVSGFEGASVYPRPGAPVDMDFPLHLAGEMDGTVFRPNDSGGYDPVPGLRIQLINNRGEVVFTSLTAFDGYYVISVIPPGEYVMMVNPDDLKGSPFRQPWPRRVTVGYDGKILSGMDINLEPGSEIPLTVATLPKPPRLGQPLPPPPPDIQVSFGEYKSDLLAYIMQWRMKRALTAAGLGRYPLIVQTKKSDQKDSKKTVTTILKSREIARAKAMCAAASQRNIDCALRVAPGVLLPPAVKQAENQGGVPAS